MAAPMVFGSEQDPHAARTNPVTTRPKNTYGQTTYLNVVEQKPTGFPKSHPFTNAKNHETLLCYIKERMDLSRNLRDGLFPRFAATDQTLAGFVRLNAEEKAQKRKNEAGEPPKPVSMSPQIALTQLGRGVTFLASVFSPEGGIFEALTTKDKQDVANALTEKMNEDSVKGRYFREYAKFFLNVLKYNLGAMHVQWKEEWGLGFKPDAGGTGIPERMLMHAGNYVKSLPMYNTFWDPSVAPCDVHKEGEWVAWAEGVTPFKFKRAIEAGEYFNTKDVINGGPASSRLDNLWYKAVPQVRLDFTGFSNAGTGADGNVDWTSILSAGSQNIKGYDGTSGVELLHMYIRLIPTEFGLTDDKTRNKMEIWYICVANGQRIVATSMQNNMHNYLPICFCQPNEDDLGVQVKSVAENLAPFQEVISFMLNSFVASTRKNIWDLMVYDPTVMDLSSVGSDVAARVPMGPGGYGKDPKASIFHFNKTLETEKLITQIQEMLQLMEWVFPTRMLQQVADIDRAVKDQVAAAVAAAQRESWKLAKIIDDQAFSPLRFVMYSNNIQYGGKLQVYNEKTGVWDEFDSSALRGTRLEFKIGDGLKTIDKLSRQLAAKEILNMILSSGSAAEFDIPSMVDYFSSTQGVEFDLTQFRKTDEQKQKEMDMEAMANAKATAAMNPQPGAAANAA